MAAIRARLLSSEAEEAVSAAPQILAAMLDVDRALGAAGVHPMSDYWRAECERQYLHPTAMQLECVGRGGIKTITSVKQDIAETLSGDFPVPPGERHYHTRISENVGEATKTLRSSSRTCASSASASTAPATRSTCTTYPRLQGPRVPHRRRVRLALYSMRRRTSARNGATGDTDPSAEVITSIRAMTVTHPNARGRMFSSPLGVAGFFHETWLRGDTGEQTAGHAPTWIANPSVTEEATHRLERDPRKWAREYAALAQSTGLGCFDLADIRRRSSRANEVSMSNDIAVIDPCSGGKDRWTYCTCGWRGTSGDATTSCSTRWRASSRLTSAGSGAPQSWPASLPHSRPCVCSRRISATSSRLRTGSARPRSAIASTIGRAPASRRPSSAYGSGCASRNRSAEARHPAAGAHVLRREDHADRIVHVRGARLGARRFREPARDCGDG